MRAVVSHINVEQGELWDVTRGQEIEILAFVSKGYETCAVWRDDYGYINTIPTHVLRMLPNVDSADKAAMDKLRHVLNVRPQPVNAIAGPATVTPRGVR